ncbi:unnamed protein product [marine sediment metagenome]|uniref:Uncharacterized protein n=1 Tax=marine sediment metagenome TaxID=412755 RepID=X1J5V8_9ZZZZ
MTYARPLIPYQEAPAYPTYRQVEAYAEDFRTGGEHAYAKDERWAKYWLSAELDILASLLRTDIYGIVAHPPGGFEVALADDIEKAEIFRGWILQYDPHHARWSLLVRSEEVGIDEFIRLRREYKAE